MTMLIDIKGLNKAFGSRAILEDASVTFSEDEKIAVIGRNGAGKSTLCRILTGEEEADSGEIWKAPSLRLSYLQQHEPWDLSETVEGFLERFTGQPDWACAKIAARFQLKGALLDSPISALSGGYRTRVKLTSMLLAEPNFIILDEPTNYLDLKTLMLLERFLLDYNGGFLVVSHDREFLKRTCESTLEVENGGLTMYPGSVEEYLEFKGEQREQAEAYNRNVEAKRKQLQRFVDRFRAKATKAAQARSKMKQLQKMKTIEIAHPMKGVKMRIPPVPERKGIALRCEELAIGYPDRTVAKDIRVEVPQGAKVAVLGENGQGKTTFLRTIAEDLSALGGGFRWGHALTVSYYAQHVYSGLDANQTVRQYLQKKAAPDVLDQVILDMAGSFLFKGPDVEKKVGVLSGGERARMVLAGLLLAKNPVLLLDEPGNHLDFETVEVLAEALANFNGTIIFVSHDRTFVRSVATEIIEVADGKVVRYPGTYEDYVWHLEGRVDEESAEGEGIPSKPSAAIPLVESAPAETLSGREAYERRKAQEAEARRRVKRLTEVEKKLDEFRKKKELLLIDIEAATGAFAVSLSARFGALEKELGALEEEWLELQAPPTKNA